MVYFFGMVHVRLDLKLTVAFSIMFSDYNLQTIQYFCPNYLSELELLTFNMPLNATQKDDELINK